MTWSVYVLQCAGDRLYTGISTDVVRRFKQHMQKSGAKFTQAYPPIAILGELECASRSDALKLEYQIKQLTPEAKRALALSWPPTHQAESEANNPHMHG
ncbi:GIY-YIG nuclease family protein [Paraperlucidibaca wandonensis]|jgi:putative endonuclease|uniref:GIY-YIG nuclease family protein n=1 Tax=Paraperlucidibaca wandonensis TaxID=1268273 RepID=A0ABW3HCP8_9GAMM|nr:GIY-YIG nuclease family protein [Paraperlucidibaca sp.]MBQ0723455.1 GIY-YIG nuclease family protein [Paraperlucidibaca sp.]MBQ0843032.1 GIY-YIG nuclease family protein [Paraperlucidibaca sp.]